MTRQNDDSRELRESILTALNYDIVGLCESHLRNDQTINLEGYHCIGNNRKQISNNAWRGSGGIGFLIKNSLYDNFEVNILDDSRDDILWIYLKNKDDPELTLYLCVCYLQPERSSRGNIAQEFYDCLLSQMYLYSTGCPIFICGDFNGRVGNLQDFNDSLDYLPKRIPIDETRNAFGDYLLDFLKDSNCCMLNGRGDYSKDNFTFVSPIGKSVVDYMIVPYTVLPNVCNFEVKLISSLIIENGVQLSTNARLPDHSILTCSFRISEYDQLNKNILDTTENVTDTTNIKYQSTRKYNVSNIPQDLFTSERCMRCLENVIDSLLDIRNIDDRINTIYESFIEAIHHEMDNKVDYKDYTPSSNKRKRRNAKPYWNNDLRDLLIETNKAEKKYLQFKGDRRIKNELKNTFKIKRRQFDKRLRQEERKYVAQRLDNIKTFNQKNPKEFWREVNKLGPGKDTKTIDSVIMGDGSVSHNPNDILSRWKQEYAKLFSGDIQNVDNDFIEQLEQLNTQLEQEFESLNHTNETIDTEQQSINDPISIEEVKRAVHGLKNGKAVGVDNVPNEILKSDKLTNILHELYNVCFSHGIVPDMWCQSIICPILKNGKDYRDPLGYRGISLMSTVAKVFSQIMNERLVRYLENNNLLSEEQNGFRCLRSCLDHIYSLCTILRNRKLMNCDTFLCFVDFSKAFDSVNHTILWNKLLSSGIHGNMFNTIRCLYSKLKTAVRLSPGILTDWFSVDTGVRQGDNLAPTLFALFIDCLVPQINNLSCGVQVGKDMISCLLYADDIVFISDSPYGLQRQLDVLHEWTKLNCLHVNIDKTKIMHVRKTTTDRCDFSFMLGNTAIDFVDRYRYLGLTVSENIDYNISVKELSVAASRALGSLTSKYLHMGNMDYATFAKIYENTVIPVMDYASGVWGLKRYDVLERLQYRAIRTFLGVGKTSPIPAITGDIGWTPVHINNQCNAIRLWCRLMNLPESRICRKVFSWDVEISARYKNTWFNSVKTILNNSGLANLLNHTDNQDLISTKYIIDSVKTTLIDNFKIEWNTKVQDMPKLRTYKLFKTDFSTEAYVKNCLSRKQRSVIARIRCGTLPLEVEQGRYRNIPLDRRFCKVCNSNLIEDENHFLLLCSGYAIRRNELIQQLSSINFDSPLDALKELLTNNSKIVANYIIDCLDIRRGVI